MMGCHSQACRRGVRFVATALLAIVGSGCAGMDWAATGSGDVATKRKQRLIEAAGRLDKHRDEAQWQAALARLRHGDPDRARDQLEALLVRNPDHADARALLAQIDDSQAAADLTVGSTVEWAIESAVDALQSNQPDVAVEILRANDVSKHFGAVEILRGGLGQFPDSAALWRALGAAHQQQGDDQSAQSALRQALSLDNTSPLAYFLLGQSLRSLGQHEQARRNFQAAADLDGRYAR